VKRSELKRLARFVYDGVGADGWKWVESNCPNPNALWAGHAKASHGAIGVTLWMRTEGIYAAEVRIGGVKVGAYSPWFGGKWEERTLKNTCPDTKARATAERKAAELLGSLDSVETDGAVSLADESGRLSGVK